MKAALAKKYGSADVLEIADIPKPMPKDKEVLIKVMTATVTAGDTEMRAFKIYWLWWILVRLWIGLFKPKQPVLGQELAGIIEAIGKDVTKYKVGDEVSAASGMHLGAYAEYCRLPEKAIIAHKPKSVSFDKAATLATGGLNGLYFIRKANIQLGQKILINGAGGSIGTYGLQIAKMQGAVVTAVDHGSKLKMLTQAGADEVIDYTQHDFTDSNTQYDVIFDVIGHHKFSKALKCVKPNGIYLEANPKLSSICIGILANMFTKKQVALALAEEKVEDMALLLQWMEEGKIDPIIDRYYDLADIKEAHQYVENGAKKGNVIIKIGINNLT